MKTNLARKRLRDGQATIGTWAVYDSPDLVEQMAHQGLDWVALDWQHGQFTESTLNQALGRFLAVSSCPIVRVKAIDPGNINRVLDMGAMGIIVPMIENAEQAREVVRAAHYPPRGVRSGGGVRLGLIGGGGFPEYLGRAQEEILVVLMVETEPAIDNVVSIMEVPGVDAVLIGPGDLMIDVKARGHDEARHEHLVLQVAEAARKTGTAAGYVCTTREIVEKRMAQGFRFLSYRSDHAILMDGFTDLRTQFKAWTREGQAR
ncbi:MAG: hypothetical protein HYU36_08140 [Planctomycetes bacterium]|nr:hypothetical protein [Planctomycetota bacterium]